MRPEDEPFIYSSWLKSFRKSKVNTGLGGQAYHNKQSQRITQILERDNTRVIVACDTEDDDLILGYCVFEIKTSEAILHYVYVKESFRRMQIASALVKMLRSEIRDKPFWYSHLPANEELLEAAQKFNIEYDPDLAGGTNGK